MSDDRIKKAAEALIAAIDNQVYEKISSNVHKAKDALKASLRPSRKEIADYLEHDLGIDKRNKMIAYAIEELRGEE